MTSCFYPVGGREKQPAKILFHNIRHHSWQPWAGFTGRRKSLFPCQSHSNAIPHTLTSVQPAAGPSEGRMDGWGKEEGKALKNKSDCKEENLWVLCHRCQSTADCGSGHPNVLVIKFGENTLAHTHRWCNWKNTVICFSLLRNLLSWLQPLTPPPCPPLRSSHCKHTLCWTNSQHQEINRQKFLKTDTWILHILHL